MTSFLGLARLTENMSSGNPAYGTRLSTGFGASEVWPLINIASGTTTITALNSTRNGTLLGWDLKNAAGPVTGSLAPLIGTGDYGNIASAGLNAIFNGGAGSLFIWGKVAAAGAWTDGVYRYLLNFVGSGSNLIYIAKSSSSNQLDFVHRGNGTTKLISRASTSPTAWFSVGLSWDIASGEVKAFYNGAQVGSTATGQGTWTGGNPTVAQIGAINTTAANPWSGWLAYAAARFGSIWTAGDFLAMHNAAATSAPDT